MSRTTGRHGPTSRKLLLFAMAAMAVALLVWWQRRGEPPMESRDAIEAEVTGENAAPKSSSAQKTPSPKVSERTTQATERPSTTSDAFTLEEVIDNPDCYTEIGRGYAEDLAVVAVPEAGGSRFAVLDGAGTVFEDELPFVPNIAQIGKRRDGSIMVGFGFYDFEREWRELQKWEEASDIPMPVRIYMDGRIIFDSTNASGFGVAENGSSFFVTEWLVGGISKLRIHDPELGVEEHYDLDQIAYPYPYFARYATSQTEVLFTRRDDISATQWSYPVDGGIPLAFKIDDDMVFKGVFASSRHGYFARRGRDQSEVVVYKREFRHDDTGRTTSTEPWSRTLDLDAFKDMQLSEDGAWLMLTALNRQVLNVETGETVFAFPTEENLSRSIDPDVPRYEHGRYYSEEALKRLANVLPDGATWRDIGSNLAANYPQSLRIRGGLLIMDMGSIVDDMGYFGELYR